MLGIVIAGIAGAGIGGYFWGKKSTGADPLWLAVAFGAGAAVAVVLMEK